MDRIAPGLSFFGATRATSSLRAKAGREEGLVGLELVPETVGLLLGVCWGVLFSVPATGVLVVVGWGVEAWVSLGFGIGVSAAGLVVVCGWEVLLLPGAFATGGGLKKRKATTHPAPRKNKKTKNATNLLKRLLNTCTILLLQLLISGC
jgi:hypothetical protein